MSARAIALLAAIAALAGPQLALAQPDRTYTNPRLCGRFVRQIANYEGMANRAEQLGNEMWEGRLRNQVELLKQRAEPFCPDVADEDSSAQAFANLLRIAGQAALTYFTFGAF